MGDISVIDAFDEISRDTEHALRLLQDVTEGLATYLSKNWEKKREMHSKLENAFLEINVLEKHLENSKNLLDIEIMKRCRTEKELKAVVSDNLDNTGIPHETQHESTGSFASELSSINDTGIHIISTVNSIYENHEPFVGLFPKKLISDFTPSVPPMVPPIVLKCIEEVEVRGLNEVGIYLVPGRQKQIKMLLEIFLVNRLTPRLADIGDIHIIAGCLLQFLQDLSEPLVYWSSFEPAFNCKDPVHRKQLIFQALKTYPRPNVETMAFILRHLKRIAQSEKCLMHSGRLFRVFGQCLLGYPTSCTKQREIIRKGFTDMLNVSEEDWYILLGRDL